MPKPLVELVLLSGESFAVHLNRTAKIGRLKEKIQFLRGIKAKHQTFISPAGEILDDDMQLRDILTDRQPSVSNDDPILSFTLLQLTQPCACCGQRIDRMKYCAVCKTAYCGAECQIADWQSQRQSCKPSS